MGRERAGIWYWLSELKRFTRLEALLLLCLGFSAGLPYLLVQGTLSAWLKDAGLEYSTIGFFAWVALAYAVKFMWAPFVDRLRFPLLCRLLGQRRGWLLAAQFGIAAGLACMSQISPGDQTLLFAGIAVFVAFCSATQDISVDAYRIQAVSAQMQGVVTSAYIAGYRVAILVAGAGALLLADDFSWSFSYQVMAALMAVGIVTALIMREPPVSRVFGDEDYVEAYEWARRRFPRLSERGQRLVARGWVHVLEPFLEIFQRFGWLSILLLCVVVLYRVSDIVMGNMANPFYLALAYSKTEIAWVSKIFGFGMMLLGSAVGAILVANRGLYSSMVFCLIAVVMTNLLFAALAMIGAECLHEAVGCSSPATFWLGAVISADNLAGGASNVVFIAFLSNQVNVVYGATQYALLSSFMGMLGKFVSGFSGVVVEQWGFASFFVYVSVWGVPSLLFLLLLGRYCAKSFETSSLDNQPTQDANSSEEV